MAAGQNVPEPGGYDFEFTSKVPDDLECPVCHFAMKDPAQIGGCGHRFCNLCIEGWLRHSLECPVDRQPLSRDKIFPDVACHRRILNLTAKCSYAGCPWKGELRAVESHQSECLLKVIECPNEGCKEKLTRLYMNNHKMSKCTWRKMKCEYCEESFIMRNKQQHHNVCQKFPVQCTNNCGLRDIPREKLVVHIGEDCRLTEVHCQYKNLGCLEKFPRLSTKGHLDSHVKSHLNLALCNLEITQKQVRDQSNQIKRLTSTCDDQSQQLNDQSQQIACLTSTVQGLVQQMERLKNKTTNEAMGGANKKGATNVKVKEGVTGWRNHASRSRDRDRNGWRRGGDDAGRDQERVPPRPSKSWSAFRRGYGRSPAEQSDGEG